MKKPTLKNLSFRSKMMLIYFICVVIPLLIISIFYYMITINKFEKQRFSDISNDVNKTGNLIQQMIDKTLMTMDYIYYDENINKCLNVSGGSMMQFIDISNGIDKTVNALYANSGAGTIEIYTSNDALYRSVVIKKISDINEDTEWYRLFLQDESKIRTIKYYNESLDRNILAIIRKFENSSDGETNILKIELPMQEISNILAENSNRENIYLLDSGNRVVSARGYSLECPEIEYNTGDEFVDSSSVISYSFNFPNGYRIAAEYKPSKAWITFDTEAKIFIFLIVMLFIISTSLIHLVDKSVVNKLEELTECTEKIKNEIFKPVREDDVGGDEIGMLTRGMNCAIIKINTLINEVYKEKMRSMEFEKEKERAELNALQSQINPHFMFNIFEVVRMKTLKKGDMETANIMKSISTMFRRLITWGDDLILLKDEMVFVNAFIELRCYNMDDEVELDIRVDEDAMMCMVPKMSVQVFVENAFNHGLEDISKNRKFSLSAAVKDEYLIIRVCDNGAGMSAQTVNAINSGLTEYGPEKHGIGISNVRKRLDLYFDSRYELEVTSIPYEKTEVTVTIPVKTD